MSRKKRSARSSSAPPPPAKRRAIAVAVIVSAVVVIAAVVAGALWMPRVKKRGVGRPVDLEIPQGASDEEIVARLEAAGVIDHPRLFSLYLSAIGGTKAKPGRHVLEDDLPPTEVVRRLRRRGDAARVKVTFPEGFNRFDMAKRLYDRRICDASEFLAATTDRALLDEFAIAAPTAEGWLFPATYVMPADGDPREVVRELLAQGRARVEKLMREHEGGVDDLATTLHFGAAEVITLASIVEKEAAADDERAIIASVFLNRLRDPAFTPRLLQADPTAAYGCYASAPPSPACVSWVAAGGGRPTAEIEHDDENAWSTYTHEGLPPTPIANPGERSILAVLEPAKTRYLYFVAKGGGHHTFSETLDGHNQAVKPKK